MKNPTLALILIIGIILAIISYVYAEENNFVCFSKTPIHACKDSAGMDPLIWTDNMGMVFIKNKDKMTEAEYKFLIKVLIKMINEDKHANNHK